MLYSGICHSLPASPQISTLFEQPSPEHTRVKSLRVRGLCI
jgi:hypothetical protein